MANDVMKVYIKPTSIWLYPYKKFSLYSLEKMLSVWDYVSKKYVQFLYEYIPEEDGADYGVLKVPIGIGVNKVRELLDSAAIPYKIINESLNFKKVYFKTPDVPSDRLTLLPKDDNIQGPTIDFLNRTDSFQKFITLDTGRGKTYCTVKHIIDSGLTAMIISYNLSPQWMDRIGDYTNLVKNKEYVFIPGTDYLYKIYNDKHFVYNPKVKIYVVSIPTLASFMKETSPLALNDIARKLGIDIKVFDEAHNRYVMFNTIDMNMQVRETVYLTATPGRSVSAENRMYSKIYDAVPSYGGFTSTMNNYYTIKYIVFDGKFTPKDVLKCKTLRGLNTFKYSRIFFDRWQKPAYELIKYLILKLLEHKKNGRVLIVMDWIKDIVALANWLRIELPEHSVGTYCKAISDKATREKELEKDIIIGTIGSMQNGKDIARLIGIIPFTQYSSQIVAHQLLGRLRYVHDSDVFYFDIYDPSVRSVEYQHTLRDQYFSKRAKNDIPTYMIDLCDPESFNTIEV